MTDDIVVTQADRDAAAEYMKAVSVMQGHDPTRAHSAFEAGLCDDLPIVQAFAACRQAEQERCAAWHDQRRRDTPDAFEMEFHEASAKAIRNGEQP